MQQATLDGTTEPQVRNRGGRPRKREDEKAVDGPRVRFYREDFQAMRDFRAAGYTGSDSSVIRQVMRQQAAQLRAQGVVATQEELPV